MDRAVRRPREHHSIGAAAEVRGSVVARGWPGVASHDRAMQQF